VFELLVKHEIEKLREPALYCAELVRNEPVRIVAQMDHKDMNRFSVLKEKVVDVAQTVLRQKLAPTRDVINSLIDAELSYINTNHPEFVSARAGLQQSVADAEKLSSQPPKFDEPEQSSGFFSMIFGGKKKPTSSDKPTPSQKLYEPPSEMKLTDDAQLSAYEKQQISIIKSMIRSYFGVIARSVQEVVTKIIWHFLVVKTKDDLHKALVADLYKEKMIETLLAESSNVSSQRKILAQQLEALKKAKKLIQTAEIRDLVDDRFDD